MLDPLLISEGLTSFAREDLGEAEWAVSPGRVPYPQAVRFMEARAALIAEGGAPELVWLVEHPPLYTAGVSAKAQDLVDGDRFPVYATGRGGQYTYHGPGQRVVYLMLDLRARKRDVRRFVQALETWVIAALDEFGVKGEIIDGRVGVWVRRKVPGLIDQEDKIAAIGVKIRRWVSFHGVSLNVDPDLGHFSGIVPCGIRDHGVTSLVDLGLPVSMDEADEALKRAFQRVFGGIRSVAPPELD